MRGKRIVIGAILAIFTLFASLTSIVASEGTGDFKAPQNTTKFKDLDMGFEYIVGLTEDGGVMVWGNNDGGQCNVPDGLKDVVSISAGWSHVLALKENGDIVAWGGNEYGQVDIPEGLGKVIGISAGTHHSVAIKADGTVIAWEITDTKSARYRGTRRRCRSYGERIIRWH